MMDDKPNYANAMGPAKLTQELIQNAIDLISRPQPHREPVYIVSQKEYTHHQEVNKRGYICSMKDHPLCLYCFWRPIESIPPGMKTYEEYHAG